MYDWRKMTPGQRKDALEFRRRFRLPWHGPPHGRTSRRFFHLVAACYEHRHIIGHSVERMALFEHELLTVIGQHCEDIPAWCVLSNHYHVLIRTDDFPGVVKAIGQMHGRLSHRWNGEENRRGRKCWHRCRDRVVRSNRHKWVTFNYINHNPVHHHYVTKWQDWPFSSASDYLEGTDATIVRKMWDSYPLLDYGKGRDDPDL